MLQQLSPEEGLRLREAAAALCVFTLVQAMENHKSKIYRSQKKKSEDAAAQTSSPPSTSSIFAASAEPKTLRKKAIPILRLIIRICVLWPPQSSSSSSSSQRDGNSLPALVEALNNTNINNDGKDGPNNNNSGFNKSDTTNSNSSSTVAVELFRETANVLEKCLGISRDSPRESIGSNVERALQDLSFFTQLCSGELLYNWVIKSLCDAENEEHQRQQQQENNNNNVNQQQEGTTNLNRNGTTNHRTPDEVVVEIDESPILESNNNTRNSNNNNSIPSHHITPTEVPPNDDDNNRQSSSSGAASAPPRRRRNNDNDDDNNNDDDDDDDDDDNEEDASTRSSNDTLPSLSQSATASTARTTTTTTTGTTASTTNRTTASTDGSPQNQQQRVSASSLSQARLSILTRQQQLFVHNTGAYHFSERSVGVVAPLALHLRGEWEKMSAAGLSIMAACAAGSSTSSTGGLGGEVVVALRLQKLASLSVCGWSHFVDQVFGGNNGNNNKNNNNDTNKLSADGAPTTSTSTATAAMKRNTITTSPLSSSTRASPSSSSSFTALLLHSTGQANLWRTLHLFPTGAELDRAHSYSTSHSIESLSASSAGTRLGGGGGLASLSSTSASNFLLNGNVAERRRVHYHAAICALAKARKALLRGELSVARQCATVAASQHAPSAGLMNTDLLLASLAMKMHIEFMSGCSRDACQTIGVILDACVDSMRQSKNLSQGPPVLRPTNVSSLVHLLMSIISVAEALLFTPQAVDESLLRRLLFILSCLFTKEGIEASNWISSASSSSSSQQRQSNPTNPADDGEVGSSSSNAKNGGGGASDASDFVDPILTRFINEQPTTTASVSSSSSSSSSSSMNPVILRLAWRRLLHYAESLALNIFSSTNRNSSNNTTTNDSSSSTDPESSDFRMNESLLALHLVASSRFHDTKHTHKMLNFLSRENIDMSTNSNNNMMSKKKSSASPSSSSPHQQKQKTLVSTSPITVICRPQLATAILLNELQQHGALSAIRLFRHKLANVLLIDQSMPRSWITLQRTIVLLCSTVLNDLGYSKAAASWIRSTLESYASDGTSRREVRLHSAHDNDARYASNSGNNNDDDTNDSGIPLYLAPFLSATSSSSLPLISSTTVLRASGGDLPSALWGLESEILSGLCHQLAKILTYSLQTPEQIEALCLDPLRQHLIPSSSTSDQNKVVNDFSSSSPPGGNNQNNNNSSSSSNNSIDIATSVDHIRSLFYLPAVGRSSSLALTSLEQVATTFLSLGFHVKASEVLADCYIVAASIGDYESAAKYRICSSGSNTYNNSSSSKTIPMTTNAMLKLRGPAASFMSKISAKKMADILLAGTLCSVARFCCGDSSNHNHANCDDEGSSNNEEQQEVISLFQDAKTCAQSVFDEATREIIRSSVFGKKSILNSSKNGKRILDRLSDKSIFKGVILNLLHDSSSSAGEKRDDSDRNVNNNSEDITSSSLSSTTSGSLEVLPLTSSLSWLSIILMAIKTVKSMSSSSSTPKNQNSFIDAFIHKELLEGIFGIQISSISQNIKDEDLNELEEVYYQEIMSEVGSRRDARTTTISVGSGGDGEEIVIINLDSAIQSPMIDQVRTVLDLFK